MDDKLRANQRHWNDLVEPHARSKFYDVDGFKKGRNTLDKIILEEIGNVKGKTLLHLQCHFGMDTLSFARMGAEVTGVDFAPKAIKLARELSKELKVPANFVCSDVYDLPNQLSGTFDIVFTSYGILAWLPDLKSWANVVSHFLKPGGLFNIIETHPFVRTFIEGGDPCPGPELVVQYPYFSKDHIRYEVSGSYAVGDDVEHPLAYEWMHTVSETLNSVIDAGLTIKSFKEYPVAEWKAFPFMVKQNDGLWHLPDGRQDIPMIYSLKATK